MKVILGHFHFCYHFNIAFDSIIDMPTRFSSPVRLFHQNSPFSHNEGSWIILKFGEFKNLSDARRAFRLKFFPKNTRDVPRLKAFQRLFRCFETSEATCPLISRGRHRGRKMSPCLLVRGTRRRWQTWRCWRRWCGRPSLYSQTGEATGSSRTARRCTSHQKSWISSGRSSATDCSLGGPSTTDRWPPYSPALSCLASGHKHLKESRSECRRPDSKNWRPLLKASPAGWTTINRGAWRRAELCCAEGEGTSSTSCRRTKCHSWLSFVLCQMSSISHSNRVLFMC